MEVSYPGTVHPIGMVLTTEVDAIHVPSTPSDVEFMNQNFKHVLSDIFYQQKRFSNSDMDTMCIDSLPLPASVTVKGPLNVQDYYELSGTAKYLISYSSVSNTLIH